MVMFIAAAAAAVVVMLSAWIGGYDMSYQKKRIIVP